MEKPGKCELCERDDTYLNFHHLIPKMVHGRNKYTKEYDSDYLNTHGAWLCKSHCHKQIHAFYSEKHLANALNTLEKLKADPKIQAYVAWHRKQKHVI